MSARAFCGVRRALALQEIAAENFREGCYMYALVRREGSLPGACVSQLVRLHVEIFRWRHVTPTRIGSAAWSTVSAASQPGAFVRTVVVCSAVAPLVFLTLAAAQSLQRSGPGSSAPDLRGGSSRGAEASVIFGAMLTVLGALNQVARHPRSSWTSLQRGNGGFVVPG
jgi:hypothetical protein